MSQGVQLNMLSGSLDIALKADVSAADGETQEQGLVFGEMLGEIVQPDKKPLAGTLRQLPAGISVLSEVSQALMIANQTETEANAAIDAPLAESLLGQIAFKSGKHNGKKAESDIALPVVTSESATVRQQQHDAGDEALKAVLLAQLDSEPGAETEVVETDLKAAREAAQAALAKGEVQPESQTAKLQTQSDSVISAADTLSDKTADEALSTKQTQVVNTELKPDSSAAALSGATKVQQPATDTPSEPKVRHTAMVIGTESSSELTEQSKAVATKDTESVQMTKNAQLNQSATNSINISAAATTESDTLTSTQGAENDSAARLVTAEQAQLVAKDSKTVLGTQTSVQQNVKITAEQPTANSQQQANQQQTNQQQASGQQFAAMLEQQNAADNQTTLKTGPESATTVKHEPQFMQQLHATEQRQQSNVSKVVAKAATEQLKQSLNLQQQDAANQLRQRVSLMVRQNIQVAEVRLDPAGLGQMQIKIDMQQDQAQVQFVVQQPQAKELLEQQLPRLRELLQQQGIVLTEGNVQQQSQQERQLAQRDSQGRGTTAHGDDSAAEPDTPAMNVQISAKINDRLVDYYA